MNNKGIKKLFEAGSRILGKTGGAAIGYSVGGYEGAVIGAASGEFLVIGINKIGADFTERVLSPREEERIGAVIMYSYNKILENLDAGKVLRDDGFIGQTSTLSPACVEMPIIERPPHKEIIEGFLLSVQREHEEKKLPFIGNLLGNIFFDRSIDKAQSNLLIRISKSISYRQLCILCIFAHTESFELRREDYRGAGEKLNLKQISILQEICDLWTQGILNCSGKAHLGLTDVNPTKMKIQGMGVMLYNLMELWRINQNDIESAVTLLRSE